MTRLLCVLFLFAVSTIFLWAQPAAALAKAREQLKRSADLLVAETDVNIDLEIISTYSGLATSWWRNYLKNSDPFLLYSAINSSRNYQKHTFNSWRKFSNSEDLYYEIQDNEINQSVHLNIFQI
ncbi:MAG: hypothetical protein DA408_16520 [Bacteroidetes bacterium]|nr:MAG: hypothetical protein C7N36_00055 [Bacteroidota bacterium]PTM10241.1 MAG: hypothetical protein DA408_16520 [Bacteroidota bacterium]